MKRNYGSFTFSEELLFRIDVAMVFAKMEFIPTKVNFNYATMNFEYIGCSRLFKNVGVNDKIPEYLIIINSDADKNIINVEAEELKIDEIPEAFREPVEKTCGEYEKIEVAK